MEIANVFVMLAAAFTPALVWLFFFLREDLHPEPRKLIAKLFIAGALASIPVFLLQSGAEWLLVGRFTALVVVLALIEEVFKFLAAYAIVRKNPAFDEPIDAMVYMVAASLGFATVENVFVTGSGFSLSASLGSFFLGGGALTALTFRFVGATLLHALSSVLVGYFWARGWTLHRVPSFVVRGIVVATAVHAIFNFLIYRFQEVNLIVPTLFLVVAGFFVLMDFEKIKQGKV